MNILLSTDENYAMPVGVLMLSICINNPEHIDFYILSGTELSESTKQLIKDNINGFSCNVYFIDIPETIKSSLPMNNCGQPEYISIATYYRLFVQDLIPANVEKILYLDGDIICRKSIKELWNTEIEGHPLTAVCDIENNDGRYHRLGYPEEEGYFNAGVLLINLKYWRTMNAQHQFMYYLANHSDQIVYHDQDIINAVFHGKIKKLSPIFNALNSYFVDRKYRFLYNNEEIADARQDPAIIHYSSHVKPWHKGCSHPYTKDFIFYLRKTIWKDYKLIPFPAQSIKDRFINILVSLGIHKYHGDYIHLS